MTTIETHDRTLRERSAAEAPIMEVRNLSVGFDTPHGPVQAVDDVSWSIRRGETLAIIGESGSGKSVGLETLMGLIKSPPATISGQAFFAGEDMLKMSGRERRALRGEKLAMIFQDALTALNPSLTIGTQISEVYRLRRGVSKKEANDKAVQLMDQVKIPSARSRLGDYPHQFSGGMCQRVMIALALAMDPEILIADEPTTALDVTVQRQIMDLLREVRDERGMSLILVTHDLGVVAEVADKAVVMYAGRIAESADIVDLFRKPKHPYSRALLRAMPRVDSGAERLECIAGTPPTLSHIPSGCAFRPRCAFCQPTCAQERPRLRDMEPNHQAACHFAEEIEHGA
ncbi:ABC transporter ATP-binding protein [Saccharospirillum sp.]|uniref:ABC transporter ATP-binding protein n=1 Tax=Saccharospirillum sp. TaxID=2033801 RepID=UPI0034A068D6